MTVEELRDFIRDSLHSLGSRIENIEKGESRLFKYTMLMFGGIGAALALGIGLGSFLQYQNTATLADATAKAGHDVDQLRSSLTNRVNEALKRNEDQINKFTSTNNSLRVVDVRSPIGDPNIIIVEPEFDIRKPGEQSAMSLVYYYEILAQGEGVGRLLAARVSFEGPLLNAVANLINYVDTNYALRQSHGLTLPADFVVSEAVPANSQFNMGLKRKSCKDIQALDNTLRNLVDLGTITIAPLLESGGTLRFPKQMKLQYDKLVPSPTCD